MTNLKLCAVVIASAVYMAIAAPSSTQTGLSNPLDKRCQAYIGPQGKGTSILNSPSKNVYSDGLKNGNQVTYDEVHNTIIITTGRDSLPESLVTVSIRAPGAVKDDGPYSYRLSQNDGCSIQLEKVPVAGSVFTVFKGPVPPIPRVNGGPCTTYAGNPDPNEVEMLSLNDVFWADGNTNGEGTVLGFDKDVRQITIVTGKESKDTSLLMFTMNVVYVAEPDRGASSSLSTGYRIRSDDNCTATLMDPGRSLSQSYKVTLGTPLIY